MEKEVIKTLEKYLEELENEHKEFKQKYKKEKPGDCGFHYDPDKKCSKQEHLRLRNIKEQKLHIKRLLKMIKEC